MNSSKELGGATVDPAAVSGAHGNPYPALPQTVPAVLRAAADLIEPEGRWTRRMMAKRSPGARRELSPLDAESGCWCALGALRRVVGVDANNPSVSACIYAVRRVADRKALWNWTIWNWNDARGRTQSQVVTAFRKAADLAEADGASTRQAPDASHANVPNDQKSGAS